MVRRRVSAVSNHGVADGPAPFETRANCALLGVRVWLIDAAHRHLQDPLAFADKRMRIYVFRFFAFTAIAAAAVRFSTPSLA